MSGYDDMSTTGVKAHLSRPARWPKYKLIALVFLIAVVMACVVISITRPFGITNPWVFVGVGLAAAVTILGLLESER